jgi:hypothetical protein
MRAPNQSPSKRKTTFAVASTDQTKPKAAKQNRKIGIAMLPRGCSFI